MQRGAHFDSDGAVRAKRASMKKKKPTAKAPSAKVVPKRTKHPRTPTGKKADPTSRASAEENARAGLRERTEEGHRMAGRTPPSSTPQRRQTDIKRKKIDE